MSKTDLSQYTIERQGKAFVTFAGLLAEAHAMGLQSIETEWLNPQDAANPIFKAIVYMIDPNDKERSFEAHGDANVNNVGPMIKTALIRMAETRAIVRALRFATNISMTAIEELSDDHSPTPAPEKSNKSSQNTPYPPSGLAHGDQGPGDHLISWGKTNNGKRVADLTVEDAERCYWWITQKCDKPSPAILETKAALEAYFKLGGVPF